MARPRSACVFRPDGSDGARLLKLLGARRLALLQSAFGGRRVWVPKAGTNMRCVACRLRDRCIREWRRRGLPVGGIARSLGVSAQTVYRVLRGGEAAARRPGCV